MTKYTVSTKNVMEHKVDGMVFFVSDGFSVDGYLKKAADRYVPHLSHLIKHHQFKAASGDVLVAQGFDSSRIVHLVLVGLGKKTKETYTPELLRQSIARALRIAESRRLATLAFDIPDVSVFDLSFDYMVQTVVTTGMMTNYHFDEFITCEDAKLFKIKEVVIIVAASYAKAAQKSVEVGTVVGEAVNTVRRWVDMPANKMTPDILVKNAQEMSKEYGIACTVFDEKQIDKLGMGGLKAVGMGSHYDPYLVIMHYKTKKKNAPTIALVGKGITFDSGGLNLKPGASMETMKEDMSGAASVINAIAALARLEVGVNVVALAAIAENMVSGMCNHPGDIVTFYNGKTAVVGNTDAEGRLVLADALAYATKHFKPDAMIDVATLTGAVSHAVGPFFSGLLTQNEMMAERVQEAAKTSGDYVWRLPFIDSYKKMVKADIADICNDGKTKYFAGPTNGACFLSHFVDTTPWAHLDIASAAFDVPDIPYYRNGATGAGTRLLIDFVLQWRTSKK